MSKLQESQPSSELVAAAVPSTTCEGFRQSANDIVWHRRDWGQNPVGHLNTIETERRTSVVRDLKFSWIAIQVPKLRLTQRSALLLLQGQALSSILIPNHFIKFQATETQLGHVLLRVDPWKYWLSVPELTGLLIAKLGEIPDGISSSEALAALVQDSAA